ncbi:MAG: molybdopterin-dependent oxidoreductase [Salinisphaeraceae bacterium]|nr:molybdopterin-dependent oxidoreductase [Salinisphaeraceae bacterium]
MRTQKTYCRICEAHCGLEVSVDGDQVVNVKPDKTHPVSKGYACIKGSAIGELHHDPDRVNHPLKKVNGKWEQISWDQAITEIGSKIKSLQKEHGKRSIAHYTGNPTAFSMQNFLYSASFMQALGSPNVYSSASIDLNNKFHVSDAVYGMLDVHPIPDFAHCNFFLCMGSNPMVSQMSVVAVTNVVDKLKAIEKRGGRVVTIDPRRTETAQKVGEHHFIKPGADVWLLLGMLHVIAHENTLTTSAYEQYAHGIKEFIASAKDWTPERVAKLTGISAENIRDLAAAYAEADGAVLYMSTGVNMGPFGSLAYWLVQGLSLITGNLDAKGGLVFPQGPFDMTKIIKALDGDKANRPRTLKDGWRHEGGAFPSAVLADEILIDHPQRIRALFVSAGNPVHSIPGNHLAEAIEKLDLLVCIDLYISETAQLADYILPATDMLERSDFPLSHLNFQAEPHAQYTQAVVKPKFERKPEWWIFTQLALAAGAPLRGPTLMNWPARLSRVLNKLPLLRGFEPDDLLALLLKLGGKTTLKELKQEPQGVTLPPTQGGNFLGKRVPSEDGKLDLAPASLLADLPRLEALAKDYENEPEGLRIIGRRERRSHNSWMHNNRRIKHDGGNQALMHPQDAKKLGIGDGELIAVSGENTITVPVKLTEDIMPGVLCVPHGWGHEKSGLGKASGLPGGNINAAIPDVAQHVEPVSGQAIMLSHRLQVRPANPQAVAV